MTETLRLAIQKGVRRRATVIAAIVGPVIALINHGDAIIGGYMEGFDWMKVCLTFLVPYTVSTVSSVLAIKERER